MSHVATGRTAGRSFIWQARRGLALALVVAIAACSGENPPPDTETSYTPSPQEPWSSDRYSSTRLVLARTADGFEVVSSTPSFGGVTQPQVGEAVTELLEEKQRLYGYAVRNSAGDVLARGYFMVPLVARATFTEVDDPERIHHAEVEDPSPLVRVAIPFMPDGATVEFQAMVPNEDRPYERWMRRSAGTVRIGAVPAQSHQQERS